MKVKLRERESLKFSQLNAGDVFTVGFAVSFIKIEPGVDEEGGRFNAVSLDTGNLILIEDNHEIHAIHGQFIEE